MAPRRRVTRLRVMRVHLRIIAAFFFAAGLLCIVAALLAPSLSAAAASAIAQSGDEGAELSATVLTLTGRGLAIGGAVFAVPCLACSWGLFRRRPWSRWVGIVLAALMLTQVPVGTAIGGYVLWVLLSRRFEPWFEPDAVEAAIPRA